MRRNNLAYREEFLAGRVGIRAKILIYLAIFAGFIISTVWMLQGVLFRNLYRGASVIQIEDAVRTQFLLTVGAIVLATVLVGFTMARIISEPIIETSEAARELSRSRYTRPPHSGGYREIAELNDTLVRAAEDLGKVEDLQRELIANISHDLRTPLTMIEGYAEAMRDIPEEVTPENMQIIIDETNRLSSMVNEVLDFSRLRTGNMELDQKPFNLTEEIREICNRQRDTAAGIRVQISDSGEGIPADELPFIWDRYYRSRENHRRAVIGSGLGLNICRGILEKHGADYGVRSEPGKGTTFWFELPKNDNA